MSDSATREVEGEEIKSVEAEFVNIRRSTIRTVEGGHVELNQVGALSIDGERLEASQSAAVIVNCGEVNLSQSVSLLAAGNNTMLTSSLSPVVLSKESAIVNSSAVGVVGAWSIKAENVSSILMISGKTEGNVTTLLDWRSALALGAAIGGVFGLLSIFKRR